MKKSKNTIQQSGARIEQKWTEPVRFCWSLISKREE